MKELLQVREISGAWCSRENSWSIWWHEEGRAPLPGQQGVMRREEKHQDVILKAHLCTVWNGKYIFRLCP